MPESLMMAGPRRAGIGLRSTGVALIGVFVGLALQAAIVTFRYGGNWTGLFCTGALHPIPPQLAGEDILLLANSNGYDGQMYHYVAHDPAARTLIKNYIDDARLRYRRILLPGAAYVLALGKQAWIDPAYIIANLVFLFLGVWWLSRYLDASGHRCRWALLFVLAPATLIALDRLTVDLAFSALCIGVAYYDKNGHRMKNYLLLALACLTRETGFLLAGAFSFSHLWERRFSKAAVISTASIPAMAWYAYVHGQTPEHPHEIVRHLIPVRGVVEALVEPPDYPFSTWASAALATFDTLALLGLIFAILLGAKMVERNGLRGVEVAILAFGVAALCMPRSFWHDAASAARVFTPMLIYVAMRGVSGNGWQMMLPLLVVMPRTWLEVGVPLLAATVSQL
jgi:hypothetical protein